MKSPFPGMDPYLEARWSDVHTKLIAFISEALQPALPSGLRARSEERILLEDDSGEPLTAYRADVALVRSRAPDEAREHAGAAIAMPDPIIVELDAPVPVDRFVKIIDTTNGNRVITVIEVLSPWNKVPGRLNRDYLSKLGDYQRGAVNVVEIDLLRGPRKYLYVNERHIAPEHREAYLIGVMRAAANRWDVYPVSLRHPVPPVPVPLRPSDQDVTLQLQPLLDRVYTAGGHDDIDYSQPPDPPLNGADEAWARELLRNAGSRK